MVHYIGYYMTTDEALQNTYSGNVPGRLKMEYVADCLRQASNEKIKILSLCFSAKGFQKKKTYDCEKCILTHIASFENQGLVRKILNRFLLFLQLFTYLVRTAKSDTIVIYHSVRITGIIRHLLRLIKRNYINEIEEIYGYAADGTSKTVEKEIKDLQSFDKYIVVNDTLPNIIGISEKKYCVCYGVYQPLQRSCERLADKIHLVYAGTIEEKKQGAMTAIAIAQHLNENYCLHIAGFGQKHVVEKVKKVISDSNAVNKCITVFHGFLSGKELDVLYWQSHIGLSTYVVESKFSNCSFPSKLTTYTSHDLAVVVCDHEAYKKSKLANNWLFFKNLEPQEIAELIKNTPIDFSFSNKDRMIQLHNDFVRDLKVLIEG